MHAAWLSTGFRRNVGCHPAWGRRWARRRSEQRRPPGWDVRFAVCEQRTRRDASPPSKPGPRRTVVSRRRGEAGERNRTACGQCTFLLRLCPVIRRVPITPRVPHCRRHMNVIRRLAPRHQPHRRWPRNTRLTRQLRRQARFGARLLLQMKAGADVGRGTALCSQWWAVRNTHTSGCTCHRRQQLGSTAGNQWLKDGSLPRLVVSQPAARRGLPSIPRRGDGSCLEQRLQLRGVLAIAAVPQIAWRHGKNHARGRSSAWLART